LSVNTAAIVDPDGAVTVTGYQWASSADAGVTWTNIAGATAANFTPTNVAGSGADTYNGQQIHVSVTYTAGGFTDTVVSAATGPTGADWTATPVLAPNFAGTAGDDIITGSLGANTLGGGAGNDIINYNVTTFLGGLTSGRDIINGGTNADGNPAINFDTGSDTFILNGSTAAETFKIMTRTEALLRIPGLTLNATTEIVITRQAGNTISATNFGGLAVLAELDNIEEIQVNTLAVTANNGGGLDGAVGAGTGDTIQILGTFGTTTNATTSLNFSTITINGGADDKVDITGLTSDHRIVFNGAVNINQVIGTLRPQDVVNYADGGNGGTDDGTVTPPPAPAVDQTLIGDDTANLLTGADGNDVAMGNGANDMISTGSGHDYVDAGAGDDTVFAGAGDDMVYGGAGSDTIMGGEGNDMITAGNGDDHVFGGAGDDMFVAATADGSDSYYGDVGTDTLDMSAVMANIEANLGTGSAGWAKVGTVSDQLYSIENIVTGSGNDTITASGSANVIDTGAGHDTVVFRSASDANHDTILNFEAGDKIDVTGFMNGAVQLVNGSTAAAGQIAVSFENIGGENFTVLHGTDALNNNFEIDIKGHHNLTGTDFAA
jgi:Ca2+-binding RTX toxin-like protein